MTHTPYIYVAAALAGKLLCVCAAEVILYTGTAAGKIPITEQPVLSHPPLGGALRMRTARDTEEKCEG